MRIYFVDIHWEPVLEVRLNPEHALAGKVVLTSCALARNVFWWVGSSATLKTGAHGSQRKGNLLALTTITINGRVTRTGRALAQGGVVNLGTGNSITLP